MPSWTELEGRFRELEPGLRWARLDSQTGTAGEYWRITAAADMIVRSRFESLATIAGRKLSQDFSGDRLPGELRDAPSDQLRWYRALATLPFYTPGPVAYPVNEKGEHAGWIATGSINNPAAVSAARCLELATMVPDEEKPASPISISVSGQNARLNVGSIDNSSNVVTSSQMTVFEDARSAISARIDGDAKTALLAKLDELQRAVNTPSYSSRYREFMKSAADHVTVLGPIVAALAAFLA
jgi:hypothetical protein